MGRSYDRACRGRTPHVSLQQVNPFGKLLNSRNVFPKPLFAFTATHDFQKQYGLRHHSEQQAVADAAACALPLKGCKPLPTTPTADWNTWSEEAMNYEPVI